MFDTAPSLIPIQSRASLVLTFLQDGRRSSFSIKAETPEIATDTTNKTASLVSTHNSRRMACDLDRELENSQAESGQRLMSTRLTTHLVFVTPVTTFHILVFSFKSLQ
ncbi:Uncharacterized protein APZ42_028801 [Daphnia magna]|uniref:Uncharacterized protein n=1 Tax=Daphnia magna TaxID=35525 RepID=A0A164QEE2_9CRUS|nr:Uncharacterized protein APZ42_028801 [Daphnia magna]